MYNNFITFELRNNKLILKLQPYSSGLTPPGVTVNKEFLKSQIINHGYGNFYIYENILEQVITDYHIKHELISKEVAEKRDAIVKITVSRDNMKAWIEVTPPYGGKDVDREMITEALEKEGIIYGINPDVIEEAIIKKSLEKTLIAEGFMPVRGKDAYFEVLVQIPEDMGKPRIREDGSVDYHDLGIVVTVEEGEPLMLKHPATSGTPGMNILGEEIPSEPGKDKPFLEMRGSKISPDNPYLLIAAIAGQPIFGPNYVKVDPIFKVANVGYETGDIKFDGTVVVTDSVADGFTIQAGGDISVGGIVEGAVLEAKGNIELKSGVIGKNKAQIKAGGNITAKFVENAYLEAEKSIYVYDMIVHSNVIAGDKIEVGIGPTSSGSKGQIVGGTYRATSLIKAKILGSNSSASTVLEVGLNPYLHKEMTLTNQELEENKKELEEIIKNIIHLRVSDREDRDILLKTLENKRTSLLEIINELNEKLKSLNEKVQIALNSKIIGTKHIYSGIKVCISNQVRVIKEDSLGASFYLRENEILAGPV